MSLASKMSGYVLIWFDELDQLFASRTSQEMTASAVSLITPIAVPPPLHDVWTRPTHHPLPRPRSCPRQARPAHGGHMDYG